jgi:hypothetical protein
LLASEARTKKGEGRALVVKGHMSNLLHRLRSLPAARLVVRLRYLIEVSSPLPAAPLAVRFIMLWPLCHYTLRVLIRGAQADSRPAVRTHASTVKRMPLKNSPARAKTLRQSLTTRKRKAKYLLGLRAHVMPWARREGRDGLMACALIAVPEKRTPRPRRPCEKPPVCANTLLQSLTTRQR